MKLKLKQEKGITLIALVITIIILLILAGVSIAMLTGDNGILNQAQTAKEKTERAGVIERVQTEIVSKQVENGKSTLSKTELKQILDSYFDGVPNNYDLNTSLALTKILNQVKVLNQLFRQKDKDDQAISEAYQTLLAMVNVIGFVYEPRQLSDDELELYQSWNDAKAKKDFQTADKIRDELIDKGII